MENWERFAEDEVERILEEVFAIFRRMLEPPAGAETGTPYKGEIE